MENKANAPVATATAVRTHEPKVTDTKCGVRIRHREYIDNVQLHQLYTLSDFPCNPGIEATFPWLSDVANSWEQYRFHSLRFRYITRASTATRGSIILAPEYDALDAPPTDEYQLTAYYGSVEDAPWKNILVKFDVDGMHPLGPRKFIRNSTQPLLGDLKTYDVGVLYIGSLDAIAGDEGFVGGKLWVEYDVELFVPQKNAPLRAGPAEPRLTVGFTGADRVITPGSFEPVDTTEEVVNTLGATYDPANGSIKFDLPGDYALRVDTDMIFTGTPAATGPNEVRALIQRSSDNGDTWQNLDATGTEVQQKRACMPFIGGTSYNCEVDFSWESILNVTADQIDNLYRVAWNNAVAPAGMEAKVRPAAFLLKAAPLFAKALSS